MTEGNFLPALTASLAATAAADPPRTEAFVDTMSHVLPVFDHLGAVLGFAKSDMVGKNDSLKEACAKFGTLKELVDADKQAKTVTQKGSLARNLHRLRSVVVFMEKIMANLASDSAMTFSAAVSSAYGETLSPYHSMIVRGTCNAGFLTLPTRATFLQSIGETEDSARRETEKLLPAARQVVSSVDKLYDGPMPASTSWM